MHRQIEPISDDAIVQEEAQIMAAAQHNIHAFAPLYERYFPRIYAYCLRRIGNTAEAEDLTSQTFTRALTGLDSYRGGMVSAWLFRIAHNLVVNAYRDRRAAVSLDADEIQLASDQPEPLEAVMQAETYERLHEIVALLPDDQQDLLALKMVGQLTSQEIAAVVGKSPGAVRVEMHRIIKYLRSLYQQREK